MHTTSEPWIARFSELDKRDLARVGGKGASLAELTQAGFPVLGGFCVTTEAFRAFLDGAGDTTALFSRLAALNPEDTEAVRRLGEEVRSRLGQAPIPTDIAHAVEAAWRDAGAEHSYAVRSSATAEDLPGASFAGQQDTYLNVRGREALLDKVRDCWVSLFTDRAITYRAKNGFDHRRVFLSVVVQRMVSPEVSGILFTADPIDGRRHIVSIDAGFGLGEALVSGLVSADLFKVDKRTNEVTDKKIARKTVAIRPLPGGGTRQEALPPERQTAPSLTDEAARDLARLGARIEEHYGRPQDIEWCIEAGKVYIVQSRPITTLFPMPEPRPSEQELRVYISFGHAQVMTDALLPYARSIWRRLFPFGRDETGNSRALLGAGGRLYIDPSDLLRVSPFGKVLPVVLTAVDTLMAEAVREVVRRPEFGYGTASRLTALKGVLPVVGPLLARAMWHLWLSSPEGSTGRARAYIDATIETDRSELEAAAPGARRYEVAGSQSSGIFLKIFPRIVPILLSAVLAQVILKRLLRGRGVDRELTAFAQGLDGNVTTEMDLELGDLADMARGYPEVESHLRRSDARGALESVRTLAGGEAFYQAMQGFLRKYGMRAGSEIDITRPRWSEHPTPLVQMLVGNLSREERGTHRAHHARLKQQGLEASQRLIRAAGALQRPLVRRLIRVCRNNLAIREHPKFMLIQSLGMIRSVTLECAGILVQQGRLAAREDVFFLTVEELQGALRGEGPALEEIVAVRREEHQRDRKLTPPRVLTSEGEIVTKRHSQQNLPQNALAGSAASPGIVEGKAKVVLDPSTAVLNAGEILVAPYTDPGWTPLFINARGLVMEVGGLMTHGSVVAREYGIPAVVCVVDATKRIRTGQQIRVNGDEGFVEIMR
ncbi:MAG TPA: phosphoenolpyruvate synthase [Candidatus Polarisedimenticolia bacterium]|jgi:pyruvate,water dikinase|nr:phosphoenolpyruvate synthase [Candidatus Polarisedimenticolia bacterium]